MAALHLLGPSGALLLLALLSPLETLHLGERRGDPSAPEGILSGAPDLPLIQLLRTQGPPPRPRPSGRHPQQTNSQSLRYMLQLYRSMTDRRGQPRRNYKWGSNTIRQIQPFSKTRQPGTGPWLVWTLDYRLEVNRRVARLVQAMAVYSQTQTSAHGQFWCTAKVLPDHHSTPPISFDVADLNGTTTSFGNDSWVEIDLSGHVFPWGASAGQKTLLLRLSHACVLVGKPPSNHSGAKEADLGPLGDPFLLLYLIDRQRNLQAKMDRLGQGSLQAAPARRKPRSIFRRIDQPGRKVLKKPTNSTCALRPFRVSFKQLGWDHWVIAPNWYRPQYCKGICPRTLHFGYHSPNHAIIQSFINEMIDPTVPRPSCVPYEYGPISVLTVERNGQVLLQLFEGMIAKSCTCR